MSGNGCPYDQWGPAGTGGRGCSAAPPPGGRGAAALGIGIGAGPGGAVTTCVGGRVSAASIAATSAGLTSGTRWCICDARKASS